MSFFIGFSEAKFKAQLKMCIQRIKLVNNKIENECKRLKREIAGLLNKPRKEEEKAKIKCEHLIRGDHTMAAHCILEVGENTLCATPSETLTICTILLLFISFCCCC